MAATMLTLNAQLAVSPLLQVRVGRVPGARTTTSVKATSSARLRIVCMAAPKGSSGPAIDKTGDKVADKIEEAQEICAGDDQSEECATAWNEVESAKTQSQSDPLEEYCAENPEADECRVYKD